MDSKGKEGGLRRDSVVFYRSFYEAIRELPPDQFKACAIAILDYGLDGIAPATNGIEKTVFALVKPQIDANNKRYMNGAKGGRPSTLKNQVVTEEKPNNNQDITKAKPSDNQDITKPKPNNNQSVTKPEPNVNVNDNVNVKKKDTNVSKEKAPRFVPPTKQEVLDYCQEKGYNVDCERFIDYYTSNGWMVGKNKMKDWKACVRNWSRGQRLGMTAEPKTKQRDTNVSKEKASRFCPPTREEVLAYCKEKGYAVDVERFVDYYTSNGWMVGKNKMKDWRACVRNWSRMDSGKRQDLTTEPQRKELAAEVQKSKFRNFEERAYTSEQLNALVDMREGERRWERWQKN